MKPSSACEVVDDELVDGIVENNVGLSCMSVVVHTDDSSTSESLNDLKPFNDDDGIAKIEAALNSVNSPTSTPPPQVSAQVFFQYCLVTLLIGSLLSIQVQMNNKASLYFGIDIFGTLLSFIVSTVILTVLVFIERWYLIREGIPQLPVLRWFKTPSIYNLLPGLLGVTYITGTLMISRYIGVALMWIPVVVGQITCSVLLDAYVGFNGVTTEITVFKGLSILLVFVGAVLSVLDKILIHNLSNVSKGGFAMCFVAALITGSITPVQALLNRNASLLLPSRIQTTWWSFFVGDFFASIVFIIEMCVNREAADLFPVKFRESEPMIYFGGLIGAIFIASTIIVPATIGVAPYFVCLVSGQLIGSAVIQSMGALNSQSTTVGSLQIIGIICVVAAAALQQASSCTLRSFSIQNRSESAKDFSSVHSVGSLDSSMHFRDV